MLTKARIWFALALLATTAPVLSACYTAQGAGEDLSAAGKEISGTSQKHTDYKP